MAFLNETGLARVLSGLKNVFARVQHDHDSRYYTQSQIDGIVAGDVKSVNGTYADANGNVVIVKVPYADNMTSDKTQNSEDEFVIRTTAGDASISDGDAFAIRMCGNTVHTGEIAEELNMTVTPVQRVAPNPITATLNTETFIAYVEEPGSYTMEYDNSVWDNDPEDYGVTVSGNPLDGDSITIEWDGENDPTMTVIAPRVAPDPITATIDRDTFVAYVATSGTTTLSYTSSWSSNPALYGVTVTGDPVSGDQIVIVYVKADRGTIYPATPTALKSTGWNLYNHTAGYAYLTKYSTVYGFRIGGAYTALQYSATIDGEKTTITPVSDMFTIPDDGYVWVTGGNDTTTYIINQWSDWTDGPSGDFEAYSETTVSIASVMSSYFPYGLLRVGAVRDEIDINAGLAISKIDRMAYSASNLATAQASGRAYECDTNYIYIVKETFVSNTIEVDGDYSASDHGNEFFVGTTIPVYLETMYGNNLKNKLERDVVTISQQTLTDGQKTQVRSNIDAASKDEVKPITITLDAVSNANGSYSHTTNNTLVSEDMKAVAIDVGTPETFKAPITVTTGNGTVALSCPNAVGSSTVQITLIRTQPVDVGTSYPSVTSTEFDILAGRIGSLSSLTTSAKTSTVDAINALNDVFAKIGANGITQTSSLLADAAAATGTTIFSLTGSGYSGGDIPAGGGSAAYSVAIVTTRGNNRHIFLVDESGNVWTNAYASGEWKGWRKIVYRTVGLVDGISLSTYTSTSNQYKCPSDGYIRVMSGDAVGDFAIAYVNGKVMATAKTQAVNLREYNAFQVKAGMTVYCIISGTASNCHYFQIA